MIFALFFQNTRSTQPHSKAPIPEAVGNAKWSEGSPHRLWRLGNILEVRKCLPAIPVHCTGSVPLYTGPGEQCTGFVSPASEREDIGI